MKNKIKLIYSIISQVLLLGFIIYYWLNRNNYWNILLGFGIILGLIWLDKKIGLKIWRI